MRVKKEGEKMDGGREMSRRNEERQGEDVNLLSDTLVSPPLRE